MDYALCEADGEVPQTPAEAVVVAVIVVEPAAVAV